MLVEQHAHISQMAATLAEQTAVDDGQFDAVTLWRSESSQAALRFLERLPDR